MTELETVLGAFLEATGCGVAVWTKPDTGSPVRIAGAPRDAPAEDAPTLRQGAPYRWDSPRGCMLAAAMPGPRRAWLVIGPCTTPVERGDRYLKFLLPVVSQYLQSTLEVEHAANELAERYEEINLLYTITEILGRTVSLEEASATILREISETVGARRGSILEHDRVTDTLQAVAALGVPVFDVPPIAVSDPCSVSARVFREQRSLIVEDEVDECESEALYRRGAMLSVPIMWTSPDGGARPLGVVNLSDRRSGQPFTAGDQKLITAIATQIGTAIQNARLVRASLSQQRLVQELALAHDLQMKLLPAAEVVAPDARVAARVMPTESVGGDFYNLFRLGHGRTGVMIGDVSSHGYRAALIMALAMSASAIHAQSSSDPGEMLASLYATLREELRSTEMFISAFYGIIDRNEGTMRYANSGHPHAFRVGADGAVDRLPATDPPLGMVDMLPSAVTCQWHRGKDLLVLFTDGVSDALNRFGARLGEEPVLDLVRRYRMESPGAILQRVFDELADYTGETVQPDDLAMVVVRS